MRSTLGLGTTKSPSKAESIYVYIVAVLAISVSRHHTKLTTYAVRNIMVLTRELSMLNN